jgi:hypothetical protein
MPLNDEEGQIVCEENAPDAVTKPTKTLLSGFDVLGRPHPMNRRPEDVEAATNNHKDQMRSDCAFSVTSGFKSHVKGIIEYRQQIPDEVEHDEC